MSDQISPSGGGGGGSGIVIVLSSGSIVDQDQDRSPLTILRIECCCSFHQIKRAEWFKGALKGCKTGKTPYDELGKFC